MKQTEVTIKNATGLHARPASTFVALANSQKASVTIVKDGKEFIGKSILGILSMGASKGDTITIRTEGEEEAVLLETLVDFINNLTE